MTRDARSATTLIRELTDLVPDLEIERDDLDGFHVYRTLRLTSTEKKGLDDVLAAVADNRIVQHKAVTNGVEVTFTHLTGADSLDPFGVAQAADLLKAKRTRKPRN